MNEFRIVFNTSRSTKPCNIFSDTVYGQYASVLLKLLRNRKLHELQYNRLLSWGAFEFVFISVLFHRKRSGKFAIPLRDRHKTRA